MGSRKKKGDGNSSSSHSNAHHVPSASKKTVQKLKEILNDNSLSDFEIYSALKDSNMDPDQAIHLLLSQDTFQEVKSKREKRKEMKETRELKIQEKNSDTSYSFKVGEEQSDGVALSESHTNSNDYDKSVDKRDIVLADSAPSSTLVFPIKTSKQQPSPRRQKSENRDSVSLFGKRPAATLVTWNRGTPYSGHVTMADIVRMGKPTLRHSPTAGETTYACQDSNSRFSSYNHLKPSHYSSHSQMGMQNDQQGSDSALPSDGEEDLDIGAAEGYSEILSCKVIPNYFHPDNVSLRGPRTPVSEDTSAVVFPYYVQDIANDLSHLTFGTYTSGMSTTVAESVTSDSLQNNLRKEGLSALADSFDPRNSWYADQIRHCKKLELDEKSRDNAFAHFPQSESRRPSIPQASNAYEDASSSIPDSNYMNTIRPDAWNPPLHRELQSSSLPPTSDLYRAAYSVDPVIMSEAFNSSASSLPVSYSLSVPGVSLAMGSALPQRVTAFPRSALQNSYQSTGVFHDSQAVINHSIPQFGSGASRNSWRASGSNDFLDGDLGTPKNLLEQFHRDLPIAHSAVGYGGIQSHYNEDTRLAVLQQARNSRLSAWDHGSSMRAVPNVLDGRSHSLSAENQLLFGYPQTQQLVRNYEPPGHSNVYNSQAGTIQDQQLGPGGLPFTQAQLSRPSDQFRQQRYQRKWESM